MNPPQKPVRPPKPPPVPKDHLVDANKMVETPRTDDQETYGRNRDWADFSRTLERELAAANAEIARLKAGGCARDQRTTQFCAEAVDLAQKLDAANARIRVLISERDTARMQAECNYKLREEFVGLLGTDDIERGVEVVKALKSKLDYLQHWIKRLDVIESNPTERRRWCGDPIGWLNPGQCVFVGAEKPEGLR